MDTKNGFLAVELNDADALLFKEFIKHYDKLHFILDSGVLDMKRGYATINFTPQGNIGSIERHYYDYPTLHKIK